MHRIRRRMLVAILFPLALLAGCVPPPAHDSRPTKSVVTDDRASESTLLGARTSVAAEALPAETTVTASMSPGINEITTPPATLTEPPAIPLASSIVNYTVGNGETLWTIAARPTIYTDPLLWTLIYQANRDQIKDPRQIYPGQELSIPRNVSEVEKGMARDAARRSPIFPIDLLSAQQN